MMTINNVSLETRTLQMQLTGKQQNLNKLSSDYEMSVSDKEKERRKINRDIAELNRKLRQEQLKEQEENKELQKEQKRKKVIKEELLQEMNSDSKDASEITKDSVSDDKQEGNLSIKDIPVITLKNIISADSSVRIYNVEEQISRTMDNEQDILAAEIASDELYGTDTDAKKEELSKMRRDKTFRIESLHKKEDTSMPSMDLSAKIIIRE